MTDHLLKGTQAFILGKLPQAITHFEKLISESNPGNSDIVLGYLYRGTCYLQIRDYEKAIEDFENGLKINKDSFELKFKLGIALFKSGQYDVSDKTFRAALISSTNSEEREKLILWQNKTLVEAENLRKLIQLKIGNIKFSNNWYQTGENVVITLDCNSVINKNSTQVKIDKRLISIFVESIKIHEIILSNAVDEHSSSFKLLTQKIELTLKKEVSNFSWITLDAKSAEEVQKYPSSYKNKVDFVKLDKEISNELKDDKAEGSDPMISFLKQVYSNASEETKRAMMKSYSTSGGTVLSTNWSEVKEKDYAGKDRPEPPKGQLWADEAK